LGLTRALVYFSEVGEGMARFKVLI